MKKAFAAALAALPFVASGAIAQDYPSKPVELVVHSSAGGGADLFARTVAEIIGKHKLLAQPLVVVNKGGGGGAIAFNYVAGKRGDPYVLVGVPSTVMLTAPIRSGLDIGLDRFTPLGSLGLDLNALTVGADAPYKTMAEFVEAAKREPGSIVIAFGSVGGTTHYLAYQIEKITGARFKIVSMKGAQAVLSVLGGHVHATTENLSEVIPHVEGRKLRVIGVPAARRLAAAPDIPTMAEQGFKIQSGVRRGFASPAGIPRDAAATLEATLKKVHESAEWQEHAKRSLLDNTYLDGAAFGRYLAEHQPDIVRFMSEVGINKKNR